MNIQIPFTPHPRLDYTERYNQGLDTLQRARLAEQRLDIARDAQKLKQTQDAERILENRKRQEAIEDLNLYSHLNQVQAFREYKYAYWVGTLIDQYI